jgi:hypothetical protein
VQNAILIDDDVLTSFLPAGIDGNNQYYGSATDVTYTGVNSFVYGVHTSSYPGKVNSFSGVLPSSVLTLNSCSHKNRLMNDDDTETSFSFDLAPNPTNSGFVTIQVNGADREVQLYILDAMGQLIKSEELAKPSKLHSIDLSDLPKGLYYVQIQSGTAQSIERLIVQ